MEINLFGSPEKGWREWIIPMPKGVELKKCGPLKDVFSLNIDEDCIYLLVDKPLYIEKTDDGFVFREAEGE